MFLLINNKLTKNSRGGPTHLLERLTGAEAARESVRYLGGDSRLHYLGYLSRIEVVVVRGGWGEMNERKTED